SKAVCLGLKRMLLRFGIVSNLHRREIEGYGTHWTLSMADKGQAKRFAQLVGPHLTEIKAAKVDRWLVEWGDWRSATNIGIPASFLAAELERRTRVTGRSKRQLGVERVVTRVPRSYTVRPSMGCSSPSDSRTSGRAILFGT